MKEGEFMNLEKLMMENRIARMSARNRDNGNIIKKLRRKLRKMES